MQVRVGVRAGEPDQGGRRAVALVLDHLLLRHPARDGRRARPLLVTSRPRPAAVVFARRRSAAAIALRAHRI